MTLNAWFTIRFLIFSLYDVVGNWYRTQVLSWDYYFLHDFYLTCKIYKSIFATVVWVASLTPGNLTFWNSGLSDLPGLTIASDPLSPIVFLKLKKTTGSSENDLELLNKITERVSGWTVFHRHTKHIHFCMTIAGMVQALKEDSVFIVSTKRSVLDKCRLPVGIRVFVSTGHTASDIKKVSDSLRRVAALVLAEHI